MSDLINQMKSKIMNIFGSAQNKKPCGICSKTTCKGNHPELLKFQDIYTISWCKL